MDNQDLFKSKQCPQEIKLLYQDWKEESNETSLDKHIIVENMHYFYEFHFFDNSFALIVKTWQKKKIG